MNVAEIQSHPAHRYLQSGTVLSKASSTSCRKTNIVSKIFKMKLFQFAKNQVHFPHKHCALLILTYM